MPIATVARGLLDSRERRRAARWVVGPLVAVARWIASQDDVVHLERRVATPDRPAPDLVRVADGQYPSSGRGPVVHRRFHVVLPHDADEVELLDELRTDPNVHCPIELGHFESDEGDRRLDVGCELVVEITGPYHGPVVVVESDERHIRLQTRSGHLEAGQIEFRVEAMATDHLLAGTQPGDQVFLAESWSRSADPLMDRIYRAGPGAAAQRYVWVHLCRSVAAAAGRAGAEVQVLTEWLPPLPRLAGERTAAGGPGPDGPTGGAPPGPTAPHGARTS